MWLFLPSPSSTKRLPDDFTEATSVCPPSFSIDWYPCLVNSPLSFLCNGPGRHRQPVIADHGCSLPATFCLQSRQFFLLLELMYRTWVVVTIGISACLNLTWGDSQRMFGNSVVLSSGILRAPALASCNGRVAAKVISNGYKGKLKVGYGVVPNMVNTNLCPGHPIGTPAGVHALRGGSEEPIEEVPIRCGEIILLNYRTWDIICCPCPFQSTALTFHVCRFFLSIKK